MTQPSGALNETKVVPLGTAFSKVTWPALAGPLLTTLMVYVISVATSDGRSGAGACCFELKVCNGRAFVRIVIPPHDSTFQRANR